MISIGYVPEFCVWELTLKCNMRCLHCGSRAGAARKNELTLEKALHVADQLIDMGTNRVTFIGGEIFLYEGWHKIARKLSDSGVVVNIISNGFKIGDKELFEIKSANLANVAFSLDGMEKAHNRIRNVPTSYQRVLNAIDTLDSEGLNTAVVTTITKINAYDLPLMHPILFKAGVKVWQIQLANPMGNMADSMNHMPDPEIMPYLTSFIREKREENLMNIYTGDNIGYYDDNEEYIRGLPGYKGIWRGCYAGIKVVGIDSVGNVKGCESIYSDNAIEGNLRESSLKDIWRRDGAFAYNRNFDVSMLSGNCKGCDMGEICRGGCRGACYFNTGSYHANMFCRYNVSGSEKACA